MEVLPSLQEQPLPSRPYCPTMPLNNAIYRMPLGYGPFPGPRQTATGDSVPGWNDVQTLTSTVIFKAPTKQLASFLPRPCFTIDNDDTTTTTSDDNNNNTSLASISFTRLEDLPWLAGRGYNHCGMYIHNVTCHGRDESVRGKYLSVLFEDRADPITSGREESGYAKVYASLNEEQEEIGEDHAKNWAVRMGWEGTPASLRHRRDTRPLANFSFTPLGNYYVGPKYQK